MTVEVRNRSPESWGPLADTDEKTFCSIINGRDAKDNLKAHIKKQKKLKTFRVTYVRQLVSDFFEVRSVDSYGVQDAARKFYQENKDQIVFRKKVKDHWEKKYNDVEYDSISFTQVSK